MVLEVNQEYLARIGPYLEARKGVSKPEVHDVHGRRAMFTAAMKDFRPQIPEGVSHEVLSIPTADGFQLSIYHFKRSNWDQPQPTAAVLHAHGGGLIALSPEVCVEKLAHFVLDVDVQIFSVDYRLAPEHPYPAALDDCWTCLTWMLSKADQLGIDPRRIAVMGESAGGNLAAAVALRARDRKLSPPIAQQILGSPMIDDRTTEEPQGSVVLWGAEDSLTAWRAYLGEAAGGENVPIFAAPARIIDAAGLPPLYLDCTQLESFARENFEYTRKFIEAGIETEFHIYPGLPHGFDMLLPKFSMAETLDDNRKRILRSL